LASDEISDAGREQAVAAEAGRDDKSRINECRKDIFEDQS
jgi:hypothetical protein